MADLSSLLPSYDVNLEQAAVAKFGAVAADFSSQNLSQMTDDSNSLFTHSSDDSTASPSASASANSARGGQSVSNRLGSGTWQSSRYAADLVQYAPKHRFIFKVKFIFNDPYSRSANREFMYVVKEIDKPKVTFEYDEVNMYNFKTKILKSIKHEVLQMSFHDDIQNKVVDFFNTYRTAHSPVASLTNDNNRFFEDAGMNFQVPGQPSSGIYSASMGVLANNQRNMLSHIEVVQVYGHGTRQNVFIFSNPRIESFDFDNLSHESSEGNGCTVSFNYDALYIKDEATSGTPEYSWGQSDIVGNTDATSRNQFGNALMGADNSTGNSKLLSSDALGNSIGTTASSFPQLSTDVVQSGVSELNAKQATIDSAVPSLDQARAGMNNSSGFTLDNSEKTAYKNNLDNKTSTFNDAGPADFNDAGPANFNDAGPSNFNDAGSPINNSAF